MKKLILATLACLMAVFMYAQKSDGVLVLRGRLSVRFRFGWKD